MAKAQYDLYTKHRWPNNLASSNKILLVENQPIGAKSLFSMELSHSVQIDEDSLGLGNLEQNEEKEKCETEEEGNIDLKQV